MTDVLFAIEENAQAMRDEDGIDPILVTTHPANEALAWSVVGWTIKLDPKCPPGWWLS